jgi:diaminohydroxyphosphoribosylaminopyrimidine deaminase/5-amino-6-(5-phosphoribosylamino)uracil reductase
MQGWGHTSPNPLVGAVVVRDGEIVGEGSHRHYGGAHAEIEALRNAGERTRGATLYVNLEPCAHAGKTPPCAEAIAGARVRRVVAAIPDPNPEAAGGAERLRSAGVEVNFGQNAGEAWELNAPFLNAFAAQRPWVTLKLAVSLDAAVGDYTGRFGWLTGPEARRHVHHQRAGSNAIAVGMGTVLTDDPELTVREVPSPRLPPLRVVFSRTGRLPLTSRLAQSAQQVPVLVFAESADPSYEFSLSQLGVEVAFSTGLEDALSQLAARGVRSLLVEGGPRLAASFITARLVDRLMVIQAPIILGQGAAPAFTGLPGVKLEEASRFRVVRREELGDDVLTVLALNED